MSSASASGTDIMIMPATPWNVFSIGLDGSGEQYDDSADRFTTCDIGTFTTGSMVADATANVYGQLQLLGREDVYGEEDDDSTNGNTARCIIRNSEYMDGPFQPYKGLVTEDVSSAKTLDQGDSGVVQRVTATAVVTLPDCISILLGTTYIIVNGGDSYGKVQVTLQPLETTADYIKGAGIAGADDETVINTLATACPGDYVKLVNEGTNGYVITEMRGTWAEETP
jgi:hypothetical protein